MLFFNIASYGKSIDEVVIPGKELFGISWKVNGAEFIKKLGPPDCKLLIGENRYGMMYGENVALYFDHDKLSLVFLGYNWVDDDVNAYLRIQPLDQLKWRISEKIYRGVRLKDVIKQLEIESWDKQKAYYKQINGFNTSLIFTFDHPQLLLGIAITRKSPLLFLIKHRQTYKGKANITGNDIFGLPYGSKEPVIRRRLGKPSGTIRFFDNLHGLLYGKYILLLDNDNLCGIFIKNLSGHPFFTLAKPLAELPNWEFMKINSSSSLTQIKNILKKQRKQKRINTAIFDIDNITVTVKYHNNIVSSVLILKNKTNSGDRERGSGVSNKQ
jgi:hypothetical protein